MSRLRPSIINEEEVWRAYSHLKNIEKLGIKISEYCKKYGANEANLRTIKHKLSLAKEKYPYKYKVRIKRYEEYIKSGLSRVDYAKKFDVNESELGATSLHVSYSEIIKRRIENNVPLIEFKELNNEEEKMEFISILNRVTENKEEQLIHDKAEEKKEELPRNDIELMINKGIRVIISPEIPAEKLIKIIELLKDI